jgi:hypothetical protein
MKYPMIFFTKKDNKLPRLVAMLLLFLLLGGLFTYFFMQKVIAKFIPESTILLLQPDYQTTTAKAPGLDLWKMAQMSKPTQSLLLQAPVSAQSNEWLALWENAKLSDPMVLLQRWQVQSSRTTLYHRHTLYHWTSTSGTDYCFARIKNKGLLSHSALLVEEAIRASESSQKRLWSQYLKNLPKGQSGIVMQLQPCTTDVLSQLFSSLLIRKSSDGALQGTAQLADAWQPWQNIDAKAWKQLRSNIPLDLEWLMPLLTDPAKTNATAQRCWKKYFAPWVTGQPLLGAFAGDPNAVLVLPWKDRTTAERSLKAYLSEYGQLERRDYQTFVIRQVLDASLQQAFQAYGQQNWPNLSFTLAEGCVLVSPSPAALERWIDAFVVGNVLGQSPDRYTTQSSNKALFRFPGQMAKRIAAAINLVNGQVLPPTDFYLEGDLQGPDWYFGLKPILSTQHDLPPIARVWQTALSGGDVKRLFLLAGMRSIGVQTSDHALQLLDEQGKLSWSKPLESPVLGEISTIDYFSDGEKQLFFNTATQVHCLDKQGREIIGFPLPLRVRAAAGLTVAGADLHFFIPAVNGRVYGFDHKNFPLSAWNPGPEVGILRFPVQCAQSEGQDFVFMLNTAGVLYVADYNSQLHFPVLQLQSPALSPLGLEWTPSSKRAVVLESGLKMAVIDPEGQVFRLASGLTTPAEGAHLLVEDVIGDARKDYLTLAAQQLTLHHYAGSNYLADFSRTFPQAMDTLFLAQNKKQGGVLLGVGSRKKQVLYLLDEKGNTGTGFPIAATAGGILQPSGLLIAVLEEKVYAYRVILNAEKL